MRKLWKKQRRSLSALLAAAVFGLLLAGCGGDPVPPPAAPTAAAAQTAPPPVSASPTPAPEPTPEPTPPPEGVLTVVCTDFAAVCDPLDTAAGAERLLLQLTQAPLLSRSENGGFGEAGEGRGAADLRVTDLGEGRASLRITLREDVFFADGSPADADDLLFLLYLLLDPAYDGGLRLRDCAVAGLEEYRTGISAPVLEKYAAAWPEALAGEGDCAGEAADCLREAWDRALADLVRRCRDDYLETYAFYVLGVSAEAALRDEGALRAFALWCAGLASPADDGGQIRDALGRSWNPAAGRTPDGDALRSAFASAWGSAEAFDAAFGTEVARLAREAFIRRLGGEDPENEVKPRCIEGILRADDRTVELLLESGADAAAERLGELWLLSRSALGEEGLFDPENGSFGFDPENLAEFREKAAGLAAASGAGPYAAVPSEEEGLRLQAAPLYFGEKPEIGEVLLLPAGERDPLALTAASGADLVCLPGSREIFEEARQTEGAVLRPSAGDVIGYLEAAPIPDGETAACAAALAVAAACCRISAADYFGEAAEIVPGPEVGEALEEARASLANLPEGAELPALTALVCGGGSGLHPCLEGLRAASALLEEEGLRLTVRDAETESEFWAAVDGGEASLWAAACASRLPGDGQIPVYRHMDLLVLNSERVDASALPETADWGGDPLGVLLALKLK